jgi:hypothetical protein
LPFLFRPQSGYGWATQCFREALGDPEIITDASTLWFIDADIWCVRGMTDEQAFDRPPFYAPKEHYALATVRGAVIHHTTWEFETLPAPIIGKLPRADHLVVPSQFLTRVYRGLPVSVIPLPIKPFRYHLRTHRTFRIGGLVHPSRRRNLAGWQALREALPWQFRVILVIAPELKANEELLSQVQAIADEVLCELSDRDLEAFYQSLDWFVSLSVGEGYGLPPREALKTGTPVILPKHTGFADLAGLTGVVWAPTRKAPGIPHGCWHGFVDEPDPKAVAEIIRTTPPPAVPERLPLPTKDGFIKAVRAAHELVSATVQKRVAVHVAGSGIVWVLPNAYPCGVREVAEIWAERTKTETIVLSALPTLPKAKLLIVPLHSLIFATHRPLWMLLRKRAESIVFWLHRQPQWDDEWELIASCGVATWVTTETLKELCGAQGILPNPIGDPASREPEPDLIGSFGFYTHEAATLLNELTLRLPEKRFLGLWTPSPYWSDSAPIKLWSQARQKAPSNCQHHLGPFSRQELHDYLSSLSVIVLWHHPHHGSPGEASARVPFVLRLQRPVLINDQSPLVQPYLRYLPTVARFDPEYLTSLLLRPLEAYKPVGVPTLEEELALFADLLRSVLDAR